MSRAVSVGLAAGNADAFLLASKAFYTCQLAPDRPRVAVYVQYVPVRISALGITMRIMIHNLIAAAAAV